MKEDNLNEKNTIAESEKERFKILKRIDRSFEIPMIILAFIWLSLIVLEILNRADELMIAISNVIWVIFILDFILKFIIAPKKLKFIKHNIIIIISLIIPALRMFSIFRLAWLLKLTRGIVLLRIIGGMNSSMRALTITMEKRAFGFIAILTLVVLFTGAAGMYVFERNTNLILKDYGAAVWWTAMLLTTMGTEAWPVTVEGRILCLLLALYGFTIFGYVTATFATFFLGEDSNSPHPDVASGKQMEDIQKDLKELKELIMKKNDTSI